VCGDVPGSSAAPAVGSAVGQDCYDVEWRPAEPPGTTRPPTPGRWLILSDASGLGERIAAGLEAVGESCRVLPRTDLLPAGSTPDVARLRAILTQVVQDEAALRGVVLAGGSCSTDLRSPGPEFEQALVLACAPLLAAAQALAGSTAQQPRLWSVTRGAVAAGGAAVSLATAPAWGLGRVVALEQPDVWGGLIDLDPAAANLDADAGLVVAEVLGPLDEDQVAYRSGRRLVARLARVETLPPPAATTTVDPESAYLITGGRGSLGLRIAEWLADRGARHLVLVARTPFPDVPGTEQERAAHERIERLRSAGVRVHTPSADVTDREQMSALFDSGDPLWPPIRGIVHMAGVFEPCTVGDLTWTRFRDTLRPKVDGSLVLDAVAADRPLQFFITFSSASAVWGSAMAGHYAAANYFLEVLAHDRAARGSLGTAISWGWWAGTAMGGHDPQYFERMGLHAVPEAAGLEVLDRLLAPGRPHLTVAPVDWSRFRPVLEARRRRPLLELLGDRPGAAAAEETEFVGRVRAATGAADRRRIVELELQRHVAGVLGRDQTAHLDPELGFFDAGMDSITTLELKIRLEALVGAALPTTLTLEYPTIASLAGHLLEVLVVTDRGTPPADLPRAGRGASLPGAVDGAAPEAAAVVPVHGRTALPDLPTAHAGDPLADLQSLSETELMLLLGEELEREESDDEVA
jgi:NAD(P)-dependent dehydrogenase (short-subunit alcohol dehydrogenase family)/acyl carrier protein